MGQIRSGVMLRDERVGQLAVKYRYIGGYHVFTSPDIRGLYVASKDAEKAYASVALVLTEIVREQFKLEVAVTPALSFDDFIDDSARVRITAPPSGKPRALGDRSFVIREVDNHPQ